jgi:hypothetical protein
MKVSDTVTWREEEGFRFGLDIEMVTFASPM